MVTISYVGLFLFLVTILSYIDTFFYEIPMFEAFVHVVFPEPARGRSIVVGANLIAFIVALVIDYRVWENKKGTSKQIEGK
jgi:hypothetical protein